MILRPRVLPLHNIPRRADRPVHPAHRCPSSKPQPAPPGPHRIRPRKQIAACSGSSRPPSSWSRKITTFAGKPSRAAAATQPCHPPSQEPRHPTLQFLRPIRPLNRHRNPNPFFFSSARLPAQLFCCLSRRIIRPIARIAKALAQRRQRRVARIIVPVEAGIQCCCAVANRRCTDADSSAASRRNHLRGHRGTHPERFRQSRPKSNSPSSPPASPALPAAPGRCAAPEPARQSRQSACRSMPRFANPHSANVAIVNERGAASPSALPARCRRSLRSAPCACPAGCRSPCSRATAPRSATPPAQTDSRESAPASPEPTALRHAPTPAGCPAAPPAPES